MKQYPFPKNRWTAAAFGLFLFALLLAFFGFCLNLCWAGFGSLLRVLFSRYAAVVNKVMALLMVWCAVRLFL